MYVFFTALTPVVPSIFIVSLYAVSMTGTASMISENDFAYSLNKGAEYIAGLVGMRVYFLALF
jgi:hypothetical protein